MSSFELLSIHIVVRVVVVVVAVAEERREVIDGLHSVRF